MTLQRLREAAKPRTKMAFLAADVLFREALATELERLAGLVRKMPRPAAELVNDRVQGILRLVGRE